MKKIVLVIGTVLGLVAAPSAMVIHNYCHEKKESIMTESGVFHEDYLFLGYELNFSGEAEDLVFLGKRLTFSGTTKLGLIALGEKLIYSGTSGNGIIAGGMDIVCNGSITGDSYIGCKSLTMGDAAKVNGNLFIGCAKLSIDGKLKGDLYVAAGEIVINNEILGNVVARGGRIIIGKNGKIHGNLTYYAKEKLSSAEAEKVSGVITIDEKCNSDKDWNSFVKFILSMKYLIGLGLFVSCLIVGSILLFLPVFKNLDAKQSEKTFWNTSLWGLIPMFMYPAVIVVCCALIVTIPLAIMLMLAFIPLIYSTYIIGTTLAGKYLATKFKWNVEKRHYQFLIGALAGALISIIPIVNFLAMLFICSLGWGVYISFLFNKNLTVTE